MDEPFWGQDIAVVDVEWVGGDSAVLIKHCSSTGDLEWAQQVTADEARGVCWYLARLFGQELHPEGTATKLREAEARQSAPGPLDYERVRETVPECSNMTDDAVDYLRGRLLIWRLSPDEMTVVVTVANGLLSCSGFGLNQHGSEVLAAIEACRVAVAEPEPQSTEDHLEAAESLLATCRGGIAQWSSVQAIGTEAGAHALVDIATTLRGLREDVQALTAEVREAAETGVRVVTD